MKSIRVGTCRIAIMAAIVVGIAHQSLALAQAPDAIYFNAKVVTVDARFSTEDAFAVSGDKFLRVGRGAEIRKLAGPKTRMIDLSGRTVLPGFIDSHPHVIFRGRGKLTEPSLVGLHSVAEINQRIGEAAAKASPGNWIVTSPIGEPPDYFNLPDGLAEKRWPTRADLDKVAPNNPVYIQTSPYWPHPSILNSAALSKLGVSRDTPEEPRVKIMKDASGEPTGVIYGFNIYNFGSPLFRKLVSMLPPPPPYEQEKEGIRQVLKDNISVGVTTIYEAHANTSPPKFEKQLRELKAADEATGRAVSDYEVPARKPMTEIDAWMAGLKDAQGAGTGDDYFKTVGVTVSLDGATQFGASLESEPYLDPYGQMGNGSSAFSVEQLAEVARLAIKHDLRLNVLAAGDKACDMAVEALNTVNRETPLAGRGWVLQHFQQPSKEGIAKWKAMGVVFVQTYASADFSKGIETYVKRFPGKDVWKTVVPYRWWLDAGITAAGSSDGAHYDPMFQIWETLVRVDGRTGKSLMAPAKKVTRREAIQIHTINGARLLQWGDRIGSIEPGKFADFVVLDRDILTVPVDQIRDTKTVLTAVGGKVFYDSLSLAAQH